MAIRTIQTGSGPLYYAVCSECRRESDHAMYDGVAHSDGAVNVAFPHGWTHERARTVGGGAWSRVQLDFCPACTVAPEYRKHA